MRQKFKIPLAILFLVQNVFIPAPLLAVKDESLKPAELPTQQATERLAEPGKQQPRTVKETDSPPLQDLASDESNLQGQRPKMEFERLRHDFGSLFRGQRVSYFFPFQNAGEGVLVIRSIHASCGCVNTKVEPSDTFQPGESGRLVFEFDSSMFVGRVLRTITVDTNVKNPATQTLTFTADVKPELTANPNILALGEIPKEFRQSMTINLKPIEKAEGIVAKQQWENLEKSQLSAKEKKEVVNGGPLKIVTVTSSSKLMKATLISNEVKNDPQIKIEFLGNMPIGAFRERISVWSNATYMPELVIPVVGEVVGHVRPSSKYLEFGVVAGRNRVRRSLSLQSDDKSFRVKSIDVEIKNSEGLNGVSASDLFETKVEKTKNGVVLHFDMKLPTKLQKADKSINASGQFILATTDPDYKELKVPFFGVLRKED